MKAKYKTLENKKLNVGYKQTTPPVSLRQLFQSLFQNMFPESFS